MSSIIALDAAEKRNSLKNARETLLVIRLSWLVFDKMTQARESSGETEPHLRKLPHQISL